MRKNLSYIGWGLVGIAFIVLIYFALQNNVGTVDFRGTVVEISSANGNVTYIEAIMVFGTLPITIRVNTNISIRNQINGERMSIDDIAIGDMIDLDIREKCDVTMVIIPRWIRVLPR